MIINYEELLAKINKFTDTAMHESSYRTDIEPYNALRAVVELHKPKDYAQDTQYPFVGCIGCGREYPCPTIQAIEKELN